MMLTTLTLAGALALAAEQPVVLTSFYPTTYLAERLAGDAAEVSCPLPEDEDPAFWEPPREVLRRYQEADLVVLNGAGLERWPRWASLAPSRVVVSARPFRDQWLRYEGGATHTHGPDGEHAHEGFDGHTWLDPVLAAEQAKAIERGLARVAPEHREAFAANLADLLADLAELDAAFAELEGPPAGEVVLASHPAYRYLARRYAWPVVSLDLDPETPPTAEQLADARERLGGRGARWIWWESTPSEAVAARVREALGVESVVVSPVETPPGPGRDFLSVQRENLAAIAATFAQEEEP